MKKVLTANVLARPRYPRQLFAPANGNRWTEAIWVLSAAAILLLLLNSRAFTTAFFAENFQHLGPFRQLGNCLLCTLTRPTAGGGWFRPIDAFTTVISFEVLGLNPLVHHLRNYFLLMANLFLLQQFLWEVVPEQIPRLLGLALVALSKANFTTIGYINIFGSLLEAMWILVAILLFIRFIKQGGHWNYVLASIAAILCIFTKETGVSVFVVLAALVVAFARPTDGLERYVRRWAIYLAPVGLAVVALLVIRSLVAGSTFPTNAVYAPALSFEVFARDGSAFLAAPANLAFVNHAVMGNGGVAALLAARLGLGTTLAYSADALVLLVLGILLGRLWHRSVLSPRLWVFPLAWMTVVFCLVISVRNLQIYYTYDFVLAFSILLAMLLVGSGRRAQCFAIGTLAVVALNGLVSNATSTYTYELVAADAACGIRNIAVLCRGSIDCDHLVFETTNVGYWVFTLGTMAPSEPMLPELLRRPKLTVEYVTPAGVAAFRDKVEPATTFVDIDHGFTRIDPTRPAPTGPPVILSFGPAQGQAGVLFNQQPGGLSALWFTVEDGTPDTVVIFAGTLLSTTVSPGLDLITALIDASLYAHPGQYPIVLRNLAGDSNIVELNIMP